jgi:hypothetical protein
MGLGLSMNITRTELKEAGMQHFMVCPLKSLNVTSTVRQVLQWCQTQRAVQTSRKYGLGTPGLTLGIDELRWV